MSLFLLLCLISFRGSTFAKSCCKNKVSAKEELCQIHTDIRSCERDQGYCEWDCYFEQISPPMKLPSIDPSEVAHIPLSQLKTEQMVELSPKEIEIVSSISNDDELRMMKLYLIEKNTEREYRFHESVIDYYHTLSSPKHLRKLLNLEHVPIGNEENDGYIGVGYIGYTSYVNLQTSQRLDDRILKLFLQQFLKRDINLHIRDRGQIRKFVQYCRTAKWPKALRSAEREEYIHYLIVNWPEDIDLNSQQLTIPWFTRMMARAVGFYAEDAVCIGTIIKETQIDDGSFVYDVITGGHCAWSDDAGLPPKFRSNRMFYFVHVNNNNDELYKDGQPQVTFQSGEFVRAWVMKSYYTAQGSIVEHSAFDLAIIRWKTQRQFRPYTDLNQHLVRIGVDRMHARALGEQRHMTFATYKCFDSHTPNAMLKNTMNFMVHPHGKYYTNYADLTDPIDLYPGMSGTSLIARKAGGQLFIAAIYCKQRVSFDRESGQQMVTHFATRITGGKKLGIQILLRGGVTSPIFEPVSPANVGKQQYLNSYSMEDMNDDRFEDDFVNMNENEEENTLTFYNNYYREFEYWLISFVILLAVVLVMAAVICILIPICIALIGHIVTRKVYFGIM